MKRHLIFLMAIAAVFYTTALVWRWNTSQPKFNLPVMIDPSTENQKTALIAPSPNPKSAIIQQADIHTEKPTPATLEIASIWVVGDDVKRKAAEANLATRIGKLTKFNGSQLQGELEAITADLGVLGKILDTTPMRPSVMNVAPPLRRADGTRYSSQGVMSGMSPNAIIDAEQRQAYLDKMAHNQENNRISSWLTQAGGDYNGLMVEFDFALRQLQEMKLLTKEEAKAALQKARREGK